ncbi:MAG: hypothetical protein K0Q73_8402 [Paenibacillus sp.]|jgi:parallel beta-helix repeat protein|nr:hypothetical protein [Paenibacillus sp.]
MSNQHGDEGSKISRRKMLASIGVAGVALASSGLLSKAMGAASAEPNEDTQALVHDAHGRMKLQDLLECDLMCVRTIAQLRAMTSPNPDMVYYVRDRGQEGPFYYDAADVTTADNLGTVLVSTSGARFKRIYNKIVHVNWFGAKGDGTTDDTLAVRNTLNALLQGETVMFPVGTYHITGNIPVQQTGITLCGQGPKSKLVYTYEQQPGDNFNTAALFTFNSGLSGVTVKDIQLQYTGTFFPAAGQSYNGWVCGLKFSQCSDILIANVEVSGFNSSGIMIETGNAEIYAERFKVHQCYLHHNRVAGITFGNVEYISILDCDLTYNGSEPDGGTGYGCSGWSGESPKFVQIISNRANFNYRKGIDLHAGVEALIEGNLCHGNRLYGIYAEGTRTGNIVIKGNIISGMSKPSTGLPNPYYYITGIDIGPYSESLVAEDYHHYTIEGNQIIDFGLDSGEAYAIHGYLNFQKGSVQIRNNVIRAGRIVYVVGLVSTSSGNRDIMLDVSGNQVYVQSNVGYYPFYVLNCKEIDLSGNHFKFDQTVMTDGLIITNNDSLQSITYIGNHIRSPQTYAYAWKGYDTETWLQQKMFRSGNFVNGTLEP